MARVPKWRLRHRATVEPYAGDTGSGPAHDPPKQVRGLVEDKRRLVRNDEGAEVVSETTFYTRLEHADRFNAGARVTVNGRTSTVITAARWDDRNLGGWQHLAVSLT